MLFINSFLSGDYTVFWTKMNLVLILWCIVLAAIVIDLISGVRKARRSGSARTSYGFRRTVTKAVQYYSLLLFALMFDVISSLLVNVPYVTALGSVFLVFIEARSVYENGDKKMRKRASENLHDLLLLMDNKDDIVKAIAAMLREQLNRKDTSRDAG